MTKKDNKEAIERDDYIVSLLHDIKDEDDNIDLDIAISILQERNPGVNVVSQMIQTLEVFMTENGVTKSSLTNWNRFYYRQNHHRTVKPEIVNKIVEGKKGKDSKIKVRKAKAQKYSERIKKYIDMFVDRDKKFDALCYIIDRRSPPSHLLMMFSYHKGVERLRQGFINERDSYFKMEVRKSLEECKKEYESYRKIN